LEKVKASQVSDSDRQRETLLVSSQQRSGIPSMFGDMQIDPFFAKSLVDGAANGVNRHISNDRSASRR
jgi:hypothetical protein